MTPDPRYIYYSASHRECLAQMTYGVHNRRGFIVITGEVGTGKTTLIRTLMEKLDENTRVAYLYHAILGAKGLFQSILRDYKIPFDRRDTKTDLMYLLQDFLFSLEESDENAVLIIDEAQNLKPHILEEIRLISNIETPKKKLIQLLLVGQPEFAKILDRTEVRQLKQRIALRFHLTRLNREETEAYVSHRLRVAGYARRNPLFTRSAIDEIFLNSGGIPRAINIMCDNALVMGYSVGADQITPGIIGKVQFSDEYQELNTLSLSDPEEIEIRNISTDNDFPEIVMTEAHAFIEENEDSAFKKLMKNMMFWRKRQSNIHVT